jgi:hypothetical protein
MTARERGGWNAGREAIIIISPTNKKVNWNKANFCARGREKEQPWNEHLSGGRHRVAWLTWRHQSEFGWLAGKKTRVATRTITHVCNVL